MKYECTDVMPPLSRKLPNIQSNLKARQKPSSETQEETHHAVSYQEGAVRKIVRLTRQWQDEQVPPIRISTHANDHFVPYAFNILSIAELRCSHHRQTRKGRNVLSSLEVQ